MINRIRLTLVSFLAYAVMAGMISQIGIMINPMAAYFGKEATDIANQFSWLTMGILLGSVISLGVFDFLKIKTLNIIIFSTIVLSVVGFYLTSSFALNALLLGAIGLGCGVALPAAAIIIARSYEPERRATMLVITDASFSLSGAFCSALAVIYLSWGSHWSSGFSTVAILASGALVLTLFSRFPEVQPEEKTNPMAELVTWPLSVYLCMAALFVYLIGQNFILIWIPGYAETLPDVSADEAGGLVSNYWTGMFVGQLVAIGLLAKFRVATLALMASVLALIATFPLWLVTNINLLSTMTFVWGMFTLGLLKLILSWATEMVSLPSPRLISALLMAATLGTAVSPTLSSKLVDLTTIQTPIQVGSYCFLGITVLLILARIKK